MTDADEFFRPRDHFAVEVCQAPLDTDSRIARAWAYRSLYGPAALVEALRVAATVEPLPSCLAGLLRALDAEAAA